MKRALLSTATAIALSALTACARPTAPTIAPTTASTTAKLRFRVSLAPELASSAVSGRVLVVMSPASAAPRETVRLDMRHLGDVWLAGADVAGLSPGASFDVDPEAAAFPRGFSRAAPGMYDVMAVVDLDKSFPRTGLAPGDLRSRVVRVSLPHAGDLPLRVDAKVPEPPPFVETASVKRLRIASPALREFSKSDAPVEMTAAVVLPPGFDATATKRYATVYVVAGYGANDERMLRVGARYASAMAEHRWPEMIYVLFSGAVPGGHHVFVDSENNGPWTRALLEDFIPELEKRYPVDPRPGARFLNGHSSGGWATLWLQLTHPEAFGGTWSTSPDPTDFTRFIGGASVTPGSTDNVFRLDDGTRRNLWRLGAGMSVEEFARLELAEGGVGSVLNTFDWQFSPRGEGAAGPRLLFDRTTGAQDPAVQKAWEKFDLKKLVDANWTTLAPKVRGKIHIACGGADEFHLEEATTRFCAALREKGSDATCEIVPGKGHGDLFGPEPMGEHGMLTRFAREMWQAYGRLK